ncbi:MAG: sterol desaturase family protein [Bacteroidota bacterium]
MQILVDQFGWLPTGVLSTVFIFLRYAVLAGLCYFIFYVWQRQAFLSRKIQRRLPKLSVIRHEISHSLLTAGVFALAGLGIYGLRLLGWSKIYLEVAEYGWWYLLLSFVLLVVLHDAYFYWMHRALHHPKLFRVFHRVHHQSHNPTPWASLAFHPWEAIAEIAIIPILVLIIPFHPIAILAFASWSLLWNIIGHLGYELFPAGWVDHPVLKWFNTSTHHNLHHKYAHGNYGLYFNWWDHWMGTNRPEYKPYFRALTAKKKEEEGLIELHID